MIVNRGAHHHHPDRVSAAIVAGLRIITDETLVYSCVRGRRHAATLSRPVVTTPPSLMTEFCPHTRASPFPGNHHRGHLPLVSVRVLSYMVTVYGYT